MRGTLEQRFWAKVKKTDGCWEWTACCSSSGYGQICRGGHSGPQVQAHRLSWELHNGPIPDGMCVLHRCDNPSHLFLGTIADNNADMAAKGRAAHQHGETNGSCRLTADQVNDIRLYLAQGVKQRTLASYFGVHQTTICDINIGRRRRQA